MGNRSNFVTAMTKQETNMDATHEEKYRGFTIKLYPNDLQLDSPRVECDNLGTMVYWHRRYNLGDVDGEKNYSSPDAFLEEVERKHAIMLPLALIDHSGISMYEGSGAHPVDPGGWNSGQVGWIYVLPEKVKKEYGCKRITPTIRKRVLACLRSEIHMFDAYLRNDIVEYTVEDENGNVIDGCAGFYPEQDGSSRNLFGFLYVVNEAKSNIDAHIDRLRAKHWAYLKDMIRGHVPFQFRAPCPV